VLKKIFAPKNDEGSQQFSILHNEELHDLDMPLVVRIVKSRLWWAGNVARMGEVECL